MPYNITPSGGSQPKLTHDPTVTINGDPMGFVGTDPYGQMTEAILFGAVNSLLADIDAVTGWDLVGVAKAFEDLLLGLKNGSQPVNAINIFGWLSGVPATAITAAPAKALWNPDFRGDISFEAGDGWTWDGTTYFQVPEADSLTGSAHVPAGGGVKALRSNPITVTNGQSLAIDIKTLVFGLVATGSPIRVDVVKFKGGTEVGAEVVVAIEPPTDDPTGWVTSLSAAKAGALVGTYTVPDDDTVDQVLLRLVIDATATAGVVWFSHAAVEISGGLIPDLQTGIERLTTDFNAGNDAFNTLMVSWWNSITTDTDWLTLINDLGNAWNTYITTVTALGEDEYATLQQIINKLFGINVATGQVPPTRVAGFEGIPDLGATFTDMLNQLGAALGGDVEDAGGFAWLAQLMNAMGVKADAAHLQSIDNANVLGIRNNVVTYIGLDDTSEANMTVTDIDTSTSGYVVSAPHNTCAAVVRSQKSGDKGALSLLVDKQSATTFYVSIFKIDFSTSTLVLQRVSPNLITFLPASGIGWVRYVFDTTPVTVAAGDVLVAAFQSDTAVRVYGRSYTVPPHPTANMASIGATVSIPATPAAADLADAGWDWTTGAVIPYCAFEIVDVGAGVFSPELVPYKTVGTVDVEPPAWASHVQVAASGGGGGGGGGGLGYGDNTGYPGGTTTVTVDGFSPLVAPGGAGAIAGVVPNPPPSHGQGMGNITEDGVTYFGGSEVDWQVPGSAPGGGGGGGQFFDFGGYGGSASAWQYMEYSLAGVSNINVVVGDGGAPNGAFSSAPGARGEVWLRFVHHA